MELFLFVLIWIIIVGFNTYIVSLIISGMARLLDELGLQYNEGNGYLVGVTVVCVVLSILLQVYLIYPAVVDLAHTICVVG